MQEEAGRSQKFVEPGTYVLGGQLWHVAPDKNGLLTVRAKARGRIRTKLSPAEFDKLATGWLRPLV